VSVITIHEAKTHLSQLIQRALDGEEIIIAKRNQPLVRLEVIRAQEPVRRFGGCKHLVISMGDDFDLPMDENGNFAGDDLPFASPDPLLKGVR